LPILGRTERRYEAENRCAYEKDTLQRAREKAAEEGRPFSDLIQDALAQYLNKGVIIPEEPKLAFQLFCERPMKVPPEQFRYVLDEET